MHKPVFFLIITILMTPRLMSQEITELEFKKLQNPERVIYYNDNENQYHGCGLNLDCIPLPVMFKSIFFDKKRKQLTIDGFIKPYVGKVDTVGTKQYEIFIARPRKKKLKDVHVLMDRSNISNPETGYFKVQFSFSKKDRLYIESGRVDNLNEYNIGLLLRK
jgi:hypothetical protein